MKLSVNLDFIYEGADYEKAIREAAGLGYKNFEIVFMEKKDMNTLLALKEELGINYEVMMTDFIPWIDGAREDEFVAAAEKRIAEAKALGCGKIIFFTDDTREDMTHEQQLCAIRNCAARMLPMFEKAGVTLLLEPINKKVDHRECSIWDFYEARDIVRELDSPNFKMLFDIYHMQIMHGDVTRMISENLDLIVHVHCAGNPGRCEIYSGELNYKNILDDICRAGYKGCAGLEYRPVENLAAGLEKIKEILG